MVLNGKGNEPVNIRAGLLRMAHTEMIGFFDKSFSASNLRSTALLSLHAFGAPYAGYSMWYEKPDEQEEKYVGILEDLRAFSDAHNTGDIQMVYYSHELLVAEVGGHMCVCMHVCVCVCVCVCV